MIYAWAESLKPPRRPATPGSTLAPISTCLSRASSPPVPADSKVPLSNLSLGMALRQTVSRWPTHYSQAPWDGRMQSLDIQDLRSEMLRDSIVCGCPPISSNTVYKIIRCSLLLRDKTTSQALALSVWHLSSSKASEVKTNYRTGTTHWYATQHPILNTQYSTLAHMHRLI